MARFGFDFSADHMVLEIEDVIGKACMKPSSHLAPHRRFTVEFRMFCGTFLIWCTGCPYCEHCLSTTSC